MSQKYVVGSPDWRSGSTLVNATPLNAIKSSTTSLLNEAATLDPAELLRGRSDPIRHVPAAPTEALGSWRV